LLSPALEKEAKRLEKNFLRIENLPWLTNVNGFPKTRPNCVRVLSDEALTRIHGNNCATTMEEAYTTLKTYFADQNMIVDEVEDNIIFNHNDFVDISIYTLLIRIFEIETTPIIHWYDELTLL
jgi:hypothetical protein